MKNTNNTNRRRNTNRPRKTIFAKPLFPEDEPSLGAHESDRALRTGSADRALRELLEWDLDGLGKMLYRTKPLTNE